MIQILNKLTSEEDTKKEKDRPSMEIGDWEES